MAAGKTRSSRSRPAPYASPGENELVVRNRAVAINPIDWIPQIVGDIIFPWLGYPMILGSDVAGEGTEVGAGVARFKVGDRVLGHAVGADKGRKSATEGGFQEYTIRLANMAAPIPASLSFEAAAVWPLGLSTAAAGVFQKDFLALKPPCAHPSPLGETVVVWGGSTSVGSNAIQLAIAAGYDVITTASPGNFEYVKSLGARQAFDDKSPAVVRDMLGALKGRTVAGALAVGIGSAPKCLEIVAGRPGKRTVAMATPPGSFEKAPPGAGRLWPLIPVLAGIVAGSLSMGGKARPVGGKAKCLNASSIRGNEASPLIYETFLPQALADGRYRALHRRVWDRRYSRRDGFAPSRRVGEKGRRVAFGDPAITGVALAASGL